MLATPLGNALRETVRAWAVDEGMVAYDQRLAAQDPADAQRGTLRHVVVRVGINTGQGLVTIVTAPGAEKAVDALAPRLTAAHPELVGLVHSVNDGTAEVTGGLPSRVAWGKDWLEERVHGVKLRLSSGAFFQTNTKMAERLYERAAEAAGLTGNEVLYDLYAGAGSVGLVLAPKASEVVAIEIIKEAVRDARANAKANGFSRYQAICGDVRVVLREQRTSCRRPTLRSSTRRGRACPAERFAGSWSLRHRCWSTSRVTRRRSPTTPGGSSTAGTAWSGFARWTCFPRPPISRRSRGLSGSIPASPSLGERRARVRTDQGGGPGVVPRTGEVPHRRCLAARRPHRRR